MSKATKEYFRNESQKLSLDEFLFTRWIILILAFIIPFLSVANTGLTKMLLAGLGGELLAIFILSYRWFVFTYSRAQVLQEEETGVKISEKYYWFVILGLVIPYTFLVAIFLYWSKKRDIRDKARAVLKGNAIFLLAITVIIVLTVLFKNIG